MELKIIIKTKGESFGWRPWSSAEETPTHCGCGYTNCEVLCRIDIILQKVVEVSSTATWARKGVVLLYLMQPQS